MQTQAIKAEQSSRNRYWQPSSLSPREIDMTIRVQIPEGDTADVGIWPSFAPTFPEPWNNMLHQRLYDGVHAGLARVGEPLPAGGIGVHITQLRLSPPLAAGEGDDEARRVGEALEALAASTVAALWSGLISLGAPVVR